MEKRSLEEGEWPNRNEWKTWQRKKGRGIDEAIVIRGIQEGDWKAGGEQRNGCEKRLQSQLSRLLLYNTI